MPSALLVAFLLAGTAAAVQTPDRPTRSEPPAGSAVTVTGCLARGEAPDTFVLNRVRWDPPSTTGKSASAHHQSPDALPPAPAPERLRLAGATTRLRLASYVGHTVTATGMLAPRDPEVRPGIVLPEAGEKPASTPPRADDMPEAPLPRIFNVRSVTDVAPQCR